MGIKLLGPDINESYIKFTVNKDGALRFGMAAIKGVGEGVVEEIIKEREKRGPFKDVYDFFERVNLQVINKKAVEALANAGAFDSLGNLHRAQFFAPIQGEEGTFIERLLRYGNRFQVDKATMASSLFGAENALISIKKPEIPDCREYTTLEKLEKEKDLLGIYLSAHPLDDYRLELKHFCNLSVAALNNPENIKNREFVVGGMITGVRKGLTKKGNEFAIATVEDYNGSYEFAFFGQDFVNFIGIISNTKFVLIRGKVVPKRFKPDEWETKVTKISLLSDVLDSMVNSITLRIPLQSLNDEIVNELAFVTMENRGKITLRFHIYDETNERQSVQLLSRSVMVNLSRELIDFFDNWEKISIALN